MTSNQLKWEHWGMEPRTVQFLKAYLGHFKETNKKGCVPSKTDWLCMDRGAHCLSRTPKLSRWLSSADQVETTALDLLLSLGFSSFCFKLCSSGANKRTPACRLYVREWSGLMTSVCVSFRVGCTGSLTVVVWGDFVIDSRKQLCI